MNHDLREVGLGPPEPSRDPSSVVRALFYERFAEEFDAHMNRYEVAKRLQLVFDHALMGSSLKGKELLDAGCGTGLFSQVAAERGAHVTSLDVGERLLAQVAAKCDSQRVVGDVTELPFASSSFDVVIATEVIEHVERPRRAVSELSRVLRPNGNLVLTTPNRLWHGAIRMATMLGLRPYHGLENWIGWSDLRDWLTADQLEVREMLGFNALPFVHPATYALIDRLDRFGPSLAGRVMINMMAVGRKPDGGCE